MKSLLHLFLLTILSTVAAAHGPALSPQQLQKREQAHLRAREAFSQCQSSLLKRSFPSAHERREEMIRRFRSSSQPQPQPQPKKRQATTTQPDIATGTNTRSPFTAIPTCVLAPESDQGPYYLPNELVRDDMRESQPGVPLLVDLQVFDANSCETLQGVVVDFWHANATGVYGGYASQGTEGDTWLRALAETDNEGVAQMTTIFPGHYTGRAIHIHIMAHIGGNITGGGNSRTYSGGTNPFVGQLFFDMNLINEVEDTDPYSSNTNPLTTNSNDRIYNRQASAVSGYDGLMDVRLLGSSVQDGIIAWASVGIDRSSNHDTGFASSGGGGGGGGGASSASVGTSSTSTATSGSAATAQGENSGADFAKGVGSPLFAGKIVAAGMGAVIAAVAFFG